MSQITRFGISMESRLLERFDELIGRHGYSSRSEALRDLVRDRLVSEEWSQSDSQQETVGTITIIYDHHQRQLTENLNEQQHKHHHAVISMMHVHLDHENCLEVLAVRGKANDLKKLADELISTRGVKHGKLVMTSTGRNL
ncbi:MAG TPA: nickel-responsive transcriptional regulator NikR [bacterium]|nr:nickel-responsive transcriptional regulator NikR [bacterium]